MKLFNIGMSPNCLRVRAVIHELGLQVELIEIDLRAKEKPAELTQANPNGKVPAFIDDDGFALFESRAINAFLASKRPDRELYPSEPKQRALVDQWSYWGAVHLNPALQAVSFERVLKARFKMGDPDEAVIKSRMAEIEKLLPVLDQALTGKEWVAGKLTLADFALAPSFVLREPAQISLANFPNVDAWLKRTEALPSWQKARS
jgi:glutathione S-transferase